MLVETDDIDFSALRAAVEWKQELDAHQQEAENTSAIKQLEDTNKS